MSPAVFRSRAFRCSSAKPFLILPPSLPAPPISPTACLPGPPISRLALLIVLAGLQTAIQENGVPRSVREIAPPPLFSSPSPRLLFPSSLFSLSTGGAQDVSPARQGENENKTNLLNPSPPAHFGALLTGIEFKRKKSARPAVRKPFCSGGIRTDCMRQFQNDLLFRFRVTEGAPEKLRVIAPEIESAKEECLVAERCQKTGSGT